ncbi:exodeoxyribonuclease VII small subunit [Candidatus Hydrogenedentota bacterium]
MAKKKEFNFEKALEELEKVVSELEEGGLPLDDALKRFETGIKLSRQCAAKLEAAEQRVKLLLEDVEGGIVEKPFGEKGGEAPEAEDDSNPDEQLLF